MNACCCSSPDCAANGCIQLRQQQQQQRGVHYQGYYNQQAQQPQMGMGQQFQLDQLKATLDKILDQLCTLVDRGSTK